MTSIVTFSYVSKYTGFWCIVGSSPNHFDVRHIQRVIDWNRYDIECKK